MAFYDITATTTSDVMIRQDTPNTNLGATALYVIVEDASGTGAEERALFAGLLPAKPSLGSDEIFKIAFVLGTSGVGAIASARMEMYSFDRGIVWTAASATWNTYSGSGRTWASAGGDVTELLSMVAVTNVQRGSTYSWDITPVGLTWGDRYNLHLRGFGNEALQKNFLSKDSAATTSLRPHTVITFTDNPPDAINDLTTSPDVSLSEASYTFRQRAVLGWSTSDADDFERYRIRFGVNRSSASDHAHKTFVYSRGSNSYLDTTLYTDGSTIYYSMYVEDQRNQSASTNTNVSNIISWKKPDAIIGRVSPSSSASTLQEMEVNVRTSTMGDAKKAVVVWADGGKSFTQNLTSAGGYLYARHRYTKATSGYTIRGVIEDTNGFRSAPDSYGTSITISNLGPIAKIVASPSRQRTGSTFSFGYTLKAAAIGVDYGLTPGLYFGANAASFAQTDGICTSFKIKVGNPRPTDGRMILLRTEGDKWRIVYSDPVTFSTNSILARRDINWKVERGDRPGFFATGGIISGVSETGYRISMSTALVNGIAIGRWRTLSSTAIPSISVSLAYTNPVHFSAKDSFARGSNRVINRFRWDTDYNGTFGSDFDSGATTSFYYAWTSATTQFVAVRAVDDSHASSVDIAGVVIETESTFRMPDDFRDVMTYRASPRSRAYMQMPVIGRDYGVFDFGSIGPRTITVRGHATTQSSTTNALIDIDRISAAFQQRKRIYILPGESAATYVQGYIVESPLVEDASDPAAKDWTLTIAIAT